MMLVNDVKIVMDSSFQILEELFICELVSKEIIVWSTMISAEDSEQARDVNLLKRISQGDEKSFAQLYDRYSGLLFSMIFRILKDEKESEDVLQEAFMLIWDKSGVFDATVGKPSTWITALARNKSIDRLRSKQARLQVLDVAQTEIIESLPTPSNPQDEIWREEKAATVRAAMKELPQEQKEVLEMAYFGGMTQVEISQKIQEPLGTIKARIRRGILKLRDGLGGRL